MRPESTIDQLMKRKANRAVACSDRQVVQCSDPGSVYDNIKRSFSTLSALQLIQVVCSLFIVLSITLMTEAEASCFLSYDSAQVSAQGDGLARLSLHGGSEGLGAHLEGRLGLPGDRSVHLRTGSCERQGLWGWGVEAGLNQEWLSQADTGLVDLAFRLSATMLIADDEENAYLEFEDRDEEITRGREVSSESEGQESGCNHKICAKGDFDSLDLLSIAIASCHTVTKIKLEFNMQISAYNIFMGRH